MSIRLYCDYEECGEEIKNTDEILTIKYKEERSVLDPRNSQFVTQNVEVTKMYCKKDKEKVFDLFKMPGIIKKKA